MVTLPVPLTETTLVGGLAAKLNKSLVSLCSETTRTPPFERGKFLAKIVWFLTDLGLRMICS